MDKKFADRLDWELTRASDNRDSLACNSHRATPPEQARLRELDTEEALTVAAELGRLGCRVVTLCGGEPTLRADWPQIAQVLSRSGVRVKLITSGQRFGRIEARLARAAGVSAVLLRLDECATTPDDDRRQRALRQLEIAATGLLDAEMPMGFITTDRPRSQAQRERLERWVSQWDPVAWQTAHCEPPRLGDLREAHGPNSAAETDPSGGCEAGRGVLGLRSDGTITGCLALPNAHGVGSVRHSPLPQLWRAAQHARRQRLGMYNAASPKLSGAFVPIDKRRGKEAPKAPTLRARILARQS